MKVIEEIIPKEKIIWNILLIITIIEGLIAEIVLFSIERDAKNVQLLGFSYSRLALIGLIFLLLGAFIYLLVDKVLRNNFIYSIHKSSKKINFIKWVSVLFIFFLCYVICIPASRFGTKAATFTRLQPLLIWVGFIGLQTYLLIKLISNQLNIQGFIKTINENKKAIFLALIIIALSSLLYSYLMEFPANYASDSLYFPPGVPLSGLQVFSVWIIFLFIFLIENGNKKVSNLSQRKVFIWGTFIAIWIVAILIWASTPLPCTDDRPGPYPPNYHCYPQVNDAMYSIGTHYLALGQGISHQDKPLYAIFLMLGQWIVGPMIDQYLLFQTIILALIPSLLFILGRRMMGYSGGMFLAALAVIQETYAISLYEKIGSVNVKMESPELLTAFLLIILCIVLLKWLKSPEQKIGAVLSGGVLGLTIMVRFNAVMIVPIIMVVFCLVNWNKKKILLTSMSLFLLLVGITSLPGYFSQGVSSEGNFILGKINSVLNNRFISENRSETNTPAVTPAIDSISANEINSFASETESSSEIEMESNDLTEPAVTKEIVGITGMAFHFLNNYYSSLAKLPTELLFEPIDIQVEGRLWQFQKIGPIWKEKINIQNALALMFSLSLIIMGVFKSIKNFGIAGLSAAIIQFGYFIGNALAMTSGGRYLEPVVWVTLIYYLLGIYTLTIIILKFLRKDFQILNFQSLTASAQQIAMPRSESRGLIFPIIGFLLLGLLAPLASLIPDQLPEQSGMQTNQLAYQYLSENSSISKTQWQTFLSDPESLVVEGIGYHPRYYRSGFFQTGNPRFELMVLGKENVFISYYTTGQSPENYFGDGSHVILIGCPRFDKVEWYGHVVVMDAYAIIQTDNEQSIYIDDGILPSCSTVQ